MSQRKLLRIGGGIAVAASLAVVSSASAVINTFTDRTSFNAAAGSIDLTEDFSSFAVDTPFRTAPVAANGFVISQEGVNSTNFRNLIDVPPLAFTDNNGTHNLSGYTNFPEGTNPGAQIRLAFPVPVRAVGADFWNTTLTEGTVVDVFSGQTLLGSFPVPLVANGFTFFGVVGNAGENITSVLLRSQNLVAGSGGEGFGLDDVAMSIIPEPATGVAAAAMSLLLMARRRTA